MATKKNTKKKVGFAAPQTEEKPNDKTQFQHAHTKTAHALEHAKMVEKGKKFWEEKEQYEHMSDVEWWQLKAAKDFETGIGQKFYRHGTLSTWTEEQIATLQRDMQETLKMAGYNAEQDDAHHVRVKTLKTTTAPNKKASAPDLSDFAAEIQKQKAKQLQQSNTAVTSKSNECTDDEDEHDPLYHFDDEIIHTGHSDEEDDDGKQSKYGGHSMSIDFDPSKLEELKSMDELAGKFDPNAAETGDDKRSSHRRTRTEALRFKLQNMQKQLEHVTELSNKQNTMLEEKQRRESQRDEQLQSQLSGLTGALQSANDELDRAEEQITEKDEEIANLRRELAISKQMNTELASTALDANSGLTADDLLKQRIKDANRFAFMLSAMQEQLDFERKQFVKRIHNLELQLEHKDVQLNALYQLYNKLVAQTKTTSWWDRFGMSGKK